MCIRDRLKTETQTLQKMIRDAIVQRDGDDDNFYVFDTICGATQDLSLIHI